MTIPDKTRHLSVGQQNAIDLLALGKTDTEAAEAAGVSRQTVNDRRNHDALFIAELNRQRQDLWSAHKERLRCLVGRAVEVLEGNLDADDATLRQQAAVHILKGVGVYGSVSEPGGPTDAEGIERGWQNDEVSRQLSRNMDEAMRQMAGM